MIFITIGTQEPFDRLIQTLDELALHYKNQEFIAQVIPSDYKIKNMKELGLISPVEFDRLVSEADLVISHAGMGTILSALVKGTPILIMPRLMELKEHKSDHQLATANVFKSLNYVYLAFDTDELKAQLATLLSGDIKPLHLSSKYAPTSFIDAIKKEMNTK